MNAVDRVVSYISPSWALSRQVARTKVEMLRHYEGAAGGRRTAGWRRPMTDANSAMEGQLERLRATARDLVRNNPFADAAIEAIANHVVGWGIKSKPDPVNDRAAQAWAEWAGTTACDADGRSDIYGLQKLVIRSVAQDGEVLVRRRLRLPADGLPIPLQLQVLEADFLDQTKMNQTLANGGRIIGGVEFDAIGRRAAYWLFPEHPGATVFGGGIQSKRIPAEGVLHIFRSERPGQVRGASWFAPVMLTLKDFDEYADAQLMKQKIAALLAGVITDAPGGNATIVGNMLRPDAEFPTLYPGGMVQAPAGTSVSFTDPPTVNDYKDFSAVTLRSIATGLGTTYEDLTGDYSQVNFSSARMSRLAHYDNVHDWRWMMLIPQFCDPVWSWAMEAALIAGRISSSLPRAKWTPPPIPMIEPEKEGLAIQRNIRSGIKSHSESLREQGFDPEEVLDELEADFKELDRRGLVLDIDPRKMTQAGQAQAQPKPDAVTSADPQPQPQRAIHVDARTFIERGAVSAPAVTVDARTTVQPAHVDARTSVDARTMPGAFQTSLAFPSQEDADDPSDGAPDPGTGTRRAVESEGEERQAASAQQLTAQQAATLAVIRRDFKARGGRPVTAAFVADMMGFSHERARVMLRRLFELGYLRGPSSPAYPV